MASSIIETDPQTGVDQPVSVIRNNFVRAKIEIEELQDGKYDKNGGPLYGVLQLASFATADLPSASTSIGGGVLVTDAAPNPIAIYSNGINWVKFSDDSVVV